MVTFTYNTRDYVFRNPDIGNANAISFQRINRNSRGGDLIIFRETDWPKTETQDLTFDFCSQADLDRMYELLKDSFGDILQYTDHENKTWEGVIQNPDVAGIQSGRLHWTINIVFEGDLV